MKNSLCAASLVLSFSAALCAAEDALAPGNLGLKATFTSVSVNIPFTGDANGNATSTLKYRAVGEKDWKNAHPLIRIENKLYASSIFYLKEKTEYEVQAVFADADGVQKQPEVGQITTRNSQVPTGSGKHFYADPAAAAGGDGSKEKPLRTVAEAIATRGAGETVHFAKGIYHFGPTIDSKITGTEQAWLHLVGEPGTTFTSANPDWSGVGKLTWEKFKQDPDGRWIYKTPVKGVHRMLVRMKPGDATTDYHLWGFLANSRGQHCGQNIQHMIDDIPHMNEFGAYVQEADALYITLPNGIDDPAKADFQLTGVDSDIWFRGSHILVEGISMELTAGFKVREPAHHVYFRRMNFFAFNKYGCWTGPQGLVEDCLFSIKPHWDWIRSKPARSGEFAWYKLKGGHNDNQCIVSESDSAIRYNTFDQGSNGVGTMGASTGSTVPAENLDIHNNYFNMIGDDCIEPDTVCNNFRAFDNKMENFFNGFSAGPIKVGPAFVVRNVFSKCQQAAIKMRNQPNGWTAYYHNVSYPGEDFHAATANNSDMPAFGPDNDLAAWIKTRNNLWVGKWRAYYMRPAFPANLLATMDFDYNGLWGLEKRPPTSVGEQHSVSAEPTFVSTEKHDLRLANAEQPFIDAGEIIPGINDEVPDPYQYKGKGPDIGVYEFGTEAPHYGVRPLKK
jgi:hypothetical protein